MWFRNNDPNNSQYFWINRRDLEIETKCNWKINFGKYKDVSTQKYRRELTWNTTFQPNKIFVTNDLFEKIIKSCKATNLKFLKLKGKLGLCLYEDICDEKEFFLMLEENFIPHDVENKQLKEENKKLNEMTMTMTMTMRMPMRMRFKHSKIKRRNKIDKSY